MKVLLVEDNEEVSGLLRLSLQEASIDTTAVVGGEAAIRQVKETQFDALLIDSVLEGEDSIELVQKIRAHKSGKNVPILMMSSIGTSLARRMATGAGCDAFLEKPFGILQLIEQLKTLQHK